jgi:hypothetical protein
MATSGNKNRGFCCTSYTNVWKQKPHLLLQQLYQVPETKDTSFCCSNYSNARKQKPHLLLQQLYQRLETKYTVSVVVVAFQFM